MDLGDGGERTTLKLSKKYGGSIKSIVAKCSDKIGQGKF